MLLSKINVIHWIQTKLIIAKYAKKKEKASFRFSNIFHSNRMILFTLLYAQNVDCIETKKTLNGPTKRISVLNELEKLLCTERVLVRQQSESAKTFITSCKFSCMYFYVASKLLKFETCIYCILL